MNRFTSKLNNDCNYRYSYGKPVKGNLLLKLTPQTPSWTRLPNLPAIRYETKVSKFILMCTF